VAEPLPPVVPGTACNSSRRSWAGLATLAVVVAAACTVAAVTYGHFLSDHRSLWYSTEHDRNAHYLDALKLASALRGFKVIEFLRELNRAYVWPPLYGLLAAPLLAFEGFDYRLAVLPSLIAWAGTAVLAFLLARRSLSERGEAAGLIAATLVLASPLHRGFATDVMLESVGAFFTLLTLFLYVLTVQQGTLRCLRWLALCLTAFFLHKYNYWLLAVFAIVGAELMVRGPFYARTAKDFLWSIDWRSTLRRELRQPLWWLTGVCVLLVLISMLSGVRSIQLAGRTVRTHPPTTLVSLGYLFFVLRLSLWGWANRTWLGILDARLKTVLFWHVCPVALYFALPRHLSTFLWYVSPYDGPSEGATLWSGLQFYSSAAVEHYHVAAWSAFVVGGLFLVTLASWRRLRPGAIAVVLLGLISAFLTCLHPNHQIRFLHTWLPAIWVCAGIGAVTASSLLSRTLGKRAAGLAVASTALLMTVMHAAPIVQGKKSWIGGPAAERASMLDVSDAICRETAGTHRFTILTTVPFRFFSQWFFLEHPDVGRKFESNWWGYGQPANANREGFQHWLQSTRCDTLVFLDGTPPDTSGMNVEVQRHLELREQVLSQRTFRLVTERAFPAQGCRLLIYRRAERN
jgi:hypothetical protein